MWILMLFSHMTAHDEPEIPDILKKGRRGANIKIWTFLRLNEDQWFTARDISGYLELPLSTVQLALRRLVVIAPRIHSEDIMIDQRGRPEKRYRFKKKE
jgi:predicted transcriptional regulator